MTKLHVACAARRDYVPHSAAMLHSVLAQRPPADLSIHFLHGPDVPRRMRKALREMVQSAGGAIEFLEVTASRVRGLRTHEHLPASHWYRIFLPELLPGVDRVLYLDADLLALKPIDPLARVEVRGRYLAAVNNVLQQDHRGRPAELGLPSGQPYFNSGVMVMNLDLMRRDGATAALVEFATANHELLAWPEQDALNAVLGHSRIELHPRWNVMNSFSAFPWAGESFPEGELAAALADPAVRHFEGPGRNKPWHYRCERDMRGLYREHRKHTPWPRFRPVGRTPLNVLRRLARLSPA